ncbi:endonuclease/exonuclease/phosphatase family protein [Streptomyces sp. NPDC052396]|uniref:endonuclease/exonuclease/phosphatase family protein n=1 Tax=Streptomyces sp. NPDC052396 TaxID=3365689 RepID=UPI0037D5AACF
MRVMSWNLWWRFGPWEHRRTAILRVLRELRPDLVGLQEVWVDGEHNLAGWLAAELGMHWDWARYDRPGHWHKRLGDDSCEVGVAVLSRWPVTDRRVLRLPAEGGRDDGRCSLHVRAGADPYPVPFFTTHLNAASHESAVRRAQVTALARFVAGHRDGTPFPPVLTGDYNALPDSDELRLLGGHRTAPAVPGQVLVDAWEYAEPTAPGATWDPANPYVADTFAPPGRIDYIHVGPPGEGGLGHVRSVRRAGDGPVDGVWPSDHAAVLAELADEARP